MGAAWFCPHCKAYHAPHVETCPAGAQPSSAPPNPASKPWGVPYTPYRDPRETFHLGAYDPCAACEGKVCGNAACPKLVTSWNATTGAGG